jgi:predicted sulfurtransferase
MDRKKSAVVAFVAVLLSVFTVWYLQRPVALEQSTWDDVLAEAKGGGYELINTEELAELYQDPASTPLLIDTRQEWEYRTGHIKGALNFPMEPTWWARWNKADELEKFLGPDKDHLLVFY